MATVMAMAMGGVSLSGTVDYAAADATEKPTMVVCMFFMMLYVVPR
jgi:hypothetical protein